MKALRLGSVVFCSVAHVDPCDQPLPDGATLNQQKEFMKMPGFNTIDQDTKMDL
jgi:hypothetical protein